MQLIYPPHLPLLNFGQCVLITDVFKKKIYFRHTTKKNIENTSLAVDSSNGTFTVQNVDEIDTLKNNTRKEQDSSSPAAVDSDSDTDSHIITFPVLIFV